MKNPGIAISIFPLSLIFLFSALGAAQTTTNSDDQPIKINTSLVHVPVMATDSAGRYVAGLKKESFAIMQDGVKQDIAFFTDDSAPMNVAILIDTSMSTSPVLDKIKSAAHDFVKIFRPEDRGMIVTFDEIMLVLQELTSDQRKLSKAINNAEIGFRPGSNLQDAIYVLVKKAFADIQGRKAIIVLTDGRVEGHAVSNQSLLNALAASDILVYPIIYQVKESSPAAKISPSAKQTFKETETEREERQKAEETNKNLVRFMDELGSATGGRVMESKSNDFKKSFHSIADELKNQYMLGYYPQNMDDGKPHQVTVRIDPKEIVVKIKRKIVLGPNNPGN